MIEIVTPTCEKGIGQIITRPDSGDLIDGIRIQPLALHPDDRGYFLELARFGQALTAAFPAASTQVSAALTVPGAIKAFHFHRHQTDLWAVPTGMLQVALVDLRPESPTFGHRNTIYTGHLRPWQILIPPGIGHGYKVISQDPALLVYLTDRFYNPADEGRIAYNDPGISYDWELQHK
ncbi:MAG TPA: dTDP-4-dehydrorhamnose 3,5-epimerase family protein [Bryobacteraceae bacterium]|nr:dTDP-4-dehydrorhamnose 3,5-epimerase [Bryobacterales bacterium]HRJ17666.1 dTDP-4-dehydrorhamnose 3,5-epimerase family protein [Bryobacteraceae bacterium]